MGTAPGVPLPFHVIYVACVLTIRLKLLGIPKAARKVWNAFLDEQEPIFIQKTTEFIEAGLSLDDPLVTVYELSGLTWAKFVWNLHKGMEEYV